MRLVGLCLLFFLLADCTSKPRRLGSDPQLENRAPGAAYTANSMAFSKEQPERAPNNYDFFYKHCQVDGEKVFYSKTSYDCSEP